VRSKADRQRERLADDRQTRLTVGKGQTDKETDRLDSRKRTCGEDRQTDRLTDRLTDTGTHGQGDRQTNG